MSPLKMLADLAEGFGGSICLRRYGMRTLICDTKARELEALGPKINYRPFSGPFWAVSSGRGKLLGSGRTPEEAIRLAYDLIEKRRTKSADS